jgi:beta-phosphoglucomutase-like phosphatase (HAD superfamily)
VIIDLLSLPLTVEDYLAQKDAIIYDLYPSACPMPGAMQLTQHFHQAQLPQAIASSSSQRPFQYKTLRYQDWLQRFDLIVLGDDPAIANGKPAPDIFLLAADRLGAVPEHCLVFEDSLAGLFSAKQAGMAVMDKGLFQAADQVLNSLIEFNPQDWNLPAVP